MTGPNLATRMGAALARRKPAGPPRAGPPPGAPPPSAPALGAPPREAAPPGPPGSETPAPEPSAPEAPPPAAQAGPKRAPLARALAGLRRHWLFAALLGAGLVLRALVLAAYQPALIYVDTLKYLYGASPGSEPFGYTLARTIFRASVYPYGSEPGEAP